MIRYVRVAYQNEVFYGILDGDNIEVLEGQCPTAFKRTGRTVAASEVRFLTPCEPEKILCSGLNYYDTILEEGAKFPVKPLLFLKPPSSIVSTGENIVQNQMVQMLTCEAELGVVIAKDCKYVPRDKALEYVWGYVVANDVTAKDLQKEDTQWARAKSFDTFLPLGREIVSGIDPSKLQVSCEINGETAQNGNTKDMIFDVPLLISFASHIMTLKAGDIIITGTPGGYGKIIHNGDTVTIRIASVGELTNTVAEDDSGWCLDSLIVKEEM